MNKMNKNAHSAKLNQNQSNQSQPGQGQRNRANNNSKIPMTNRRESRISLLNGGVSEQQRYAWRSAREDLTRQPFATLLTLLVIAISLTLPTVCYLLWKNVNSAAKEWYPIPQITVYLDKSLSDPSIDELVKSLNQLEGVGDVNYLTREQALDEFRNWSGFSSALDLLEENPLPAVAIITPELNLQGNESITTLRERISQLNGVEDVRADDNWFARLASLTELVGKISVVIGLLMVVALFLVIGNSVRLNIFSRREVINVMKLIGATDGFILRPFLNGGAMLGFIGAILAILLANLLMWQLGYAVNEVTTIFEAKFELQGLAFEEALLLVIIATMSGWGAAWLATTKHLVDFRAQ